MVTIFKLGKKYLIAFLAFLNAFGPISTDLYLPALPEMSKALNASPFLISITLSSFILVFALSMLIFGPLSDKYGRRIILIIGSLLFIISSLILALANSITILIIFRCFQALGSGALCSMSLAIVKDILHGPAMEKLISLMQTIAILAQMSVPVIGGTILNFTSWRGIFFMLSLCGLLALLGSLCIKETLKRPLKGTIYFAFTRIRYVLSNKLFFKMVFIFSLSSVPFFAYIGISTYIFQTKFLLSPQEFSYFFSSIAACGLLGPILHMKFFYQFDKKKLLIMHLMVHGISGLFILIFGNISAFIFALGFAPLSFCHSALRAPARMLMLNSIPTNTGTVSALIGCGALLIGNLGILISSLPFCTNPVFTVGILALLTGSITTIWWLKLKIS